MEVIIKLDSILKRHSTGKDGLIKLTLKNGTTIGQALEKTTILKGETEVIILNSKIAHIDTILEDGDIIELYPVVGGG